MYQPSSSQSHILNFGWPGALPRFQTAIHYRKRLPVNSQGRSFRVFLGPNLSPTQYSNLKDLLEVFDNDEFSELVLTTYSGSLSSSQRDDILRLIRRQVTGHIELRNVEPTDHEKVIKKIIYEDGPQISSSFSIRVDFLNGLPESEVQRLCTLDNLELVHLLAPTGCLLNAGGRDPCHNALEVVWKYTPSLRKCILPLDLLDYLPRAFEALQSNATLEAVELTKPLNDEVVQLLQPQGRAYERTIASISRPLVELKGLKAVAVPTTFVSSEFLSHIATLPCLVTLTISPVDPVSTVNPLEHLLEGLRRVPIYKKGTGCFEELLFLDLGPYDQLHLEPHERLQLRGLLNASRNSGLREALRTIFTDTIFCGDWLGP